MGSKFLEKSQTIMAPLSLNQLLRPHLSWWRYKWIRTYMTFVLSHYSKFHGEIKKHLTMSDMRALKCWMASSLLCCSLSRSISLVCSDRAFCTSRSLSLRLASIRACRSNSRSFSMSTLCGGWHTWSASVCYAMSPLKTTLEIRAVNQGSLATTKLLMGWN